MAINNAFVRKADRLKAEIETLQAELYNTNARDPQLRYESLKTCRMEILRSFVVHLHLAIEDLLHAILFNFLARQNRRLTKKETICIVEEMRSAELIHWCGRLKLVREMQYKDLLELNRVRNACAHRWVLDLPRSKWVGPKGSRRRQKTPIVVFKGKNLFTRHAFIEEFCPQYGRLYLNLLWKVWKMQGKL